MVNSEMLSFNSKSFSVVKPKFKYSIISKLSTLIANSYLIIQSFKAFKGTVVNLALPSNGSRKKSNIENSRFQFQLNIIIIIIIISPENIASP